MCLSAPSVPAPPPPPQEVKQPVTQALSDNARRNRTSAAMGGGSLLTGPSGVSVAPTGRSSLLGG